MYKLILAGWFMIQASTAWAGPSFPIDTEVTVVWDHMGYEAYFDMTLFDDRTALMAGAEAFWRWNAAAGAVKIRLDTEGSQVEYLGRYAAGCFEGEMWNRTFGFHGTWESCI